MKLSKDEMKNVMGGVLQHFNCELIFTNGQVIQQDCTSMNCIAMMMQACAGDSTCVSGSCS